MLKYVGQAHEAGEVRDGCEVASLPEHLLALQAMHAGPNKSAKVI